MRLHEVENCRACMKSCELADIKQAGRFFTLSYKQDGECRVFSKIDRVMVNEQVMELLCLLIFLKVTLINVQAW